MNGLMAHVFHHNDTAEYLKLMLREIQRMAIDVSGLQASAAHTEGLVNSLIALVEKALASNSDAADAAVQKALDDIKAGLDTANAAGDAEVAKATPAAPTGAAPAAEAPAAAPTGASGS